VAIIAKGEVGHPSFVDFSKRECLCQVAFK
jgi:hypothetical protein